MVGDITKLVDELERAPFAANIKSCLFYDLKRAPKVYLLTYSLDQPSNTSAQIIAEFGVLSIGDNYDDKWISWELRFCLVSSLDSDALRFDVGDAFAQATESQESDELLFRDTATLEACSASEAAFALVNEAYRQLPTSRSAAEEYAQSGPVGAHGMITETLLYMADEPNVRIVGTLLGETELTDNENQASASVFITRSGTLVGYRHVLSLKTKKRQPTERLVTTRLVTASTPEEVMVQMGYGDLEKTLYKKIGWGAPLQEFT